MRARVGKTADTRSAQRPNKSGPHALGGPRTNKNQFNILYTEYTKYKKYSGPARRPAGRSGRLSRAPGRSSGIAGAEPAVGVKRGFRGCRTLPVADTGARIRAPNMKEA